MPDPNSIVPISDEQAKAAQEALKTLQGLGGFLRETFGTVPQDILGLLGGDWLKVRRAENIVRIVEKAKERMKARRVEPTEPASLSLVLPILVAACDESRDELQELWARLLAAAADPARSKSFRNAFITAVKEMDPLDAGILREVVARGGRITPDGFEGAGIPFSASRDEVEISIVNLEKIGFLRTIGRNVDGSMTPLSVTAFGREFLRAVSN